MKLRSKLLLAAVSLLTVSVAATATSAYAWYAANRQVNASVTNVKVRSTETSISTELVTYSDAAATTTSDESFSVVSGNGNTTDTRYTITTNKAVSDISGIGDGTFHKPMIDATGKKVAGWEEGTGLTDNYYKFVLKFTGDGETKVGLYFSASSAFTTDTALNVAESVRISAVVGGTQKFVMIPNKATTHTYLKNGNEADGADLATLAKTTLTKGGKGINDKLVLVQNDFADVQTYNESVNTFLGTIDPSADSTKSLTVTFYVWIEGTTTTIGSSELTTTVSILSADLDFYTVEYVAPTQNPGA